MPRSPLPGFVAAVLLAACGHDPGLSTPAVSTRADGAVEVVNIGPSAWRDTSGWRLVEAYRAGGLGIEGQAELIEPVSVALDAAGGTYIADTKPAVIRQFGSDGAFIRSFGREGDGPGEFRAAFLAGAPGLLVVHDPQLSRTSVFDSAGGFVRSWHSACCYWNAPFVNRDLVVHIPANSGAQESPRMRTRRFLRYTLEGAVVDTLAVAIMAPEAVSTWVLRGGRAGAETMMALYVPLTPKEHMALDPGGGVLMGWSGEYRLVASRSGRDTAQLVSLVAAAAPVTEQRRARIRDSMVGQFAREFDREVVDKAFDLADIPSVAPYFTAIEIDGGRNRWIRPDDGGAADRAAFDVFDSTGAYLGRVPVPGVFGPSWRTVWGADRVATIAEDEDGLPIVVVYRTDRGVRR